MKHRPSLKHERVLQRKGLLRVAGIDEVGRGAWAGPVVAAAVILPNNAMRLPRLRNVRDSKQLTPLQREFLFPIILETCLAYGVGQANALEIDGLGIVPATRLAMHRAVDAIAPPPDALLIDAVPLPEIDLPQDAFNFADSISLSVAAASIIAKITRDRLMIEMETRYPGYGFNRHKGYGTQIHQDALQSLGACAIHRRTFQPIRAIP